MDLEYCKNKNSILALHQLNLLLGSDCRSIICIDYSKYIKIQILFKAKFLKYIFLMILILVAISKIFKIDFIQFCFWR